MGANRVAVVGIGQTKYASVRGDVSLPGLLRIAEVASRISDGTADRGVAHATSGQLLQQNLVCVLEGE